MASSDTPSEDTASEAAAPDAIDSEAPAPEAPVAEAAAPEALAAEASAAPEAPATQEATPEAPAAPMDTAEALAAAAAASPRRRRSKKIISHGQMHIKATFNNTILTITDQDGKVAAWTSGGSVGFKGSRKSTPYAAQVAAELAARKAGEMGIRKLDVIVRGSGSGRETAIRTLQNMGIEITGIKDVTPVPHNGCRPKKRKGR